MIDIKINIQNASPNIDLNRLSNDISEVVRDATGLLADVKLDIRDNYSTSPLGLYKTKEYLDMM